MCITCVDCPETIAALPSQSDRLSNVMLARCFEKRRRWREVGYVMSAASLSDSG